MSILIQDVFSESLKLSENAWPDWDFVTAIRCFHIKFRELSEVFGDATCSISLLGLVGQTCQAKTWQQVNASNPFARKYHGAVMDVQQRMWILGGLFLMIMVTALQSNQLVCCEDSCGCDLWDKEPVREALPSWLLRFDHEVLAAGMICATLTPRRCCFLGRVAFQR